MAAIQRDFLGRLVFLSLTLGLVACTSTPPKPPSPAELAGLHAKTIALAPMNLVIPLSEKLNGGPDIVVRALIAHIEDNEKVVRSIDRRTARALWIEAASAVRESGQEENFVNAARILTRLMRAQADFDALMLASLYVQNAKIVEDEAYWDSTNQKIPLVGRSKWEVETAPISTIEAASILVHVFDRNGELLHERRTGLELIQHMSIHRESRQGHDKRTWVPTDDDPPIESDRRVRAATAHALSPFLKK